MRYNSGIRIGASLASSAVGSAAVPSGFALIAHISVARDGAGDGGHQRADSCSRPQTRGSGSFIKSIVAAESNFDASAISPKGAIGLMQLMPATAQLFGADPAVPAQNVDAGTHYLRILLAKYHKYRDGLRRVIAAYNAGPAAVDHYRGVPPYPETRTYVARVLYYLRLFRNERA